MQFGMEALKGNLSCYPSFGLGQNWNKQHRRTQKIVIIPSYAPFSTFVLMLNWLMSWWKYREEDVMTSCNAEKLASSWFFSRTYLLSLNRFSWQNFWERGNRLSFCEFVLEEDSCALWICPNHLFHNNRLSSSYYIQSTLSRLLGLNPWRRLKIHQALWIFQNKLSFKFVILYQLFVCQSVRLWLPSADWCRDSSQLWGDWIRGNVASSALISTTFNLFRGGL